MSSTQFRYVKHKNSFKFGIYENDKTELLKYICGLKVKTQKHRPQNYFEGDKECSINNRWEQPDILYLHQGSAAVVFALKDKDC